MVSCCLSEKDYKGIAPRKMRQPHVNPSIPMNMSTPKGATSEPKRRAWVGVRCFVLEVAGSSLELVQQFKSILRTWLLTIARTLRGGPT